MINTTPKTDAVYGPAIRWLTQTFNAFYPALNYLVPKKDQTLLKGMHQMMNDYNALNDSVSKANTFNDLSKEDQYNFVEFVQKQLKSPVLAIQKIGLELAKSLNIDKKMIDDLKRN